MTSHPRQPFHGTRQAARHAACLVVIALAASCTNQQATAARDGQASSDLAAAELGPGDGAGADGQSAGSDAAVDSAAPADGPAVTLDSSVEHDPGPGAETWAPRDLLAQRISMFLWDRADVDPQVGEAVQAAASADDLSKLAARMLEDSRARDGVAAFFTWWLRLTDLTTAPKDDPDGIFTADVRASMQREAPAFGASVILDGDGRYETLMTAPYTFMDATLARHYGVAGVTGTAMQKVDFGTSARIGLLGEASVLARFAGNTNPTWPPRRFWLIRQTVLCRRGLSSAVPIDTSAFVISPSQSLRGQLDDLTAATSPVNCHVCHALVNPIGDAFLKFNTFGQYWDTGPAGPFDDTSGSIEAGVFFDQGLTFDDQPDLLRQLQSLPEARECFAWIVLNYGASRPSSSDPLSFSAALEPSLPSLASAFEASDGDIRQLMADVVRTPAFLQATTPVAAGNGGP